MQIFHSDESKNKVSKANKGRCSGSQNPMYGKSAVNGRKWYNNGTTQFYIFEDDQRIIDLNLIKGRL